jgi:hypothetical protein
MHQQARLILNDIIHLYFNYLLKQLMTVTICSSGTMDGFTYISSFHENKVIRLRFLINNESLKTCTDKNFFQSLSLITNEKAFAFYELNSCFFKKYN